MSAVLTRPAIVSQLGDVLQRVTNDRIQANQVAETDDIVGSLGLDSLEMLELSFEIESTWKVVLHHDDVVKLKVVSDLIDLLLERLSGPAVAPAPAPVME